MRDTSFAAGFIPCLYCGHEAEQVDHIVPRTAGGINDRPNLAPACKSCNSSKGPHPVEYFLRRHPAILDRVRRFQAGEEVLIDLLPHEPPRSPVLAQGDTVALTLRVAKSDWIRLHELAASEGLSLTALAKSGLSKELAKRGLPGLIE